MEPVGLNRAPLRPSKYIGWEPQTCGWMPGNLVPLDDADAVADRMARLFADPQAADAMGDHGTALVRSRFGGPPFRAALARLFDLPSQSYSTDRPSTTDRNSSTSRGSCEASE